MKNQPIPRTHFMIWLAIIGFIFGLVAVVAATIISLISNDLPITLENMVQAHLTNPLLWFFDLTPFVLAILMGFAGAREDRLAQLRFRYRQVYQKQDAELRQLQARLLVLDSNRQDYETSSLEQSDHLVQLQSDMTDLEQKSQEIETIISRGKRQWEATFDAVHDLIILTDVNGLVMRCNRATSEALGKDYNAIIGEPLHMLMGSPDRSRFPLSLTDHRVEMHLAGLDNWYEVSTSLLEVEGEAPGTIYVFRDITERKRSAIELQLQKQYYESLVKNSPDAIVTLKLDHTIVDCNPAFEQLFDYTAKEALGEELDSLIAPLALAEEARFLTEKAGKGELVHTLTRRRRKDGSLIDVEVFAIPVIVNEKQIGILGLYHDIRDLVRSGETLGKPIDESKTQAMVEELRQTITEPYQPSSRKIAISTIEGIGPVYAAKLAEFGIETTDDLLKTAGTRQGRKELAERSGITGKLILAWVNRADLMRVPGVGEEFSDLLEKAGVDTVSELKNRVPEHLHQRMGEVNAEKHLVRRLPSLSEVTAWIEAAKEMEAGVNY